MCLLKSFLSFPVKFHIKICRKTFKTLIHWFYRSMFYEHFSFTKVIHEAFLFRFTHFDARKMAEELLLKCWWNWHLMYQHTKFISVKFPSKSKRLMSSMPSPGSPLGPSRLKSPSNDPISLKMKIKANSILTKIILVKGLT